MSLPFHASFARALRPYGYLNCWDEQLYTTVCSLNKDDPIDIPFSKDYPPDSSCLDALINYLYKKEGKGLDTKAIFDKVWKEHEVKFITCLRNRHWSVASRGPVSPRDRSWRRVSPYAIKFITSLRNRNWSVASGPVSEKEDRSWSSVSNFENEQMDCALSRLTFRHLRSYISTLQEISKRRFFEATLIPYNSSMWESIVTETQADREAYASMAEISNHAMPKAMEETFKKMSSIKRDDLRIKIADGPTILIDKIVQSTSFLGSSKHSSESLIYFEFIKFAWALSAGIASIPRAIAEAAVKNNLLSSIAEIGCALGIFTVAENMRIQHIGLKLEYSGLTNYISSDYSTLEPLIGRKDIIDEVEGAWKTGKIPILTGKSGCGKTSILEELARMMSNSPLAPRMYGGSAIIFLEGSHQQGRNLNKLTEVINKIEEACLPTVLVLDEIGILFKEDSTRMNAIVTSIYSGRQGRYCTLIGATTHEEYDKYISILPSIERRVNVIKVKEMDEKDVSQILCKEACYNHPKIEFRHEVIELLSKSQQSISKIRNIITKLANRKYKQLNDTPIQKCIDQENKDLQTIQFNQAGKTYNEEQKKDFRKNCKDLRDGIKKKENEKICFIERRNKLSEKLSERAQLFPLMDITSILSLKIQEFRERYEKEADELCARFSRITINIKNQTYIELDAKNSSIQLLWNKLFEFKMVINTLMANNRKVDNENHQKIIDILRKKVDQFPSSRFSGRYTAAEISGVVGHLARITRSFTYSCEYTRKQSQGFFTRIVYNLLHRAPGNGGISLEREFDNCLFNFREILNMTSQAAIATFAYIQEHEFPLLNKEISSLCDEIRKTEGLKEFSRFVELKDLEELKEEEGKDKATVQC